MKTQEYKKTDSYVKTLKINARTNSFPHTCYYNHNTHRKLQCIKRTRILISIKFLKLEFMLNFLFDNHFFVNNREQRIVFTFTSRKPDET